MNNRSPTPDGGEDGFSILEILVSFVILSISLGVAVQGIGQAISNLRRASEDEQASLMARQLLAEELPQALASAQQTALVREGDGWRIELDRLGDGGMTSVSLEVQPSQRSRTYTYRTFVGNSAVAGK